MHQYVILDVFTDRPLEGNQLAVFTTAEDIDHRLLQRVAREMNLSETVFVYGPDDPASADARIQIFTPVAELPFAGHPVLGTAVFLGERDGLDTVRLETGRGTISIELARLNGTAVSGVMSQPIPTWAPFPQEDALLQALHLGASVLPVEVYDNGPRFVYVTLKTFEAVSALKPDTSALAALGEVGVCCFAVLGDQVRCRMFGPGLGVAEDPATGSAAGPLAVHLCRHGRAEFREEIAITQGVEIGRPSLLRATAYGSGQTITRVTVGGSAVLVARGEYNLG
jgi:trans-2,3-dihydro-3-hydroxyanthranilate isomerase